MNIEKIDTQGLRESYMVCIPAEDVALRCDEELKKIGRNYKIAGFRPGKVPEDIIRSRESAGVFERVRNQLVLDAVNDIIRENNLDSADETYEIVNSVIGEELKFRVIIEKMPEIPEFSWDGVQYLLYEKVDVSDKDCDVRIRELANAHPVDHPCEDGYKAQKGDVVIVDVKVRDPETGDMEIILRKHRCRIGDGVFIVALEEKLIGVSKGDVVEEEIRVPEDFQYEEIAGSDVFFSLSVETIYHTEPSVLDEDFARRLGCHDLADLKERARMNLQREGSSLASDFILHQIAYVLFENCRFDLPESMVSRFAEAIEHNNPGYSKELVIQRATRDVHWLCMVRHLCELHKVSVSHDEMIQIISVQMQSSQDPGKTLNYYREPNNYRNLKQAVLQSRLLHDLIENCIHVERVSGTLSDLMSDFNKFRAGEWDFSETSSKSIESDATNDGSDVKKSAKNSEKKSAAKKPAAKKKSAAKKPVEKKDK